MTLSQAQIVELSECIARRLASLEDEIACRLGEKGAPLPRLGEMTGHGAAAGQTLLGDVDLTEALRGIDEWRELRAAQRRLEEGEYGRCIDCGVELPFEFLRDRPLAQRCVDCQWSPRRSRPAG
ncbi:MAG: hypothetical protein J0H09_29640 [Burkholderiales bacterium]|nr:hypothetical protein [Burkholderiales bacterium]